MPLSGHKRHLTIEHCAAKRACRAQASCSSITNCETSAEDSQRSESQVPKTLDKEGNSPQGPGASCWCWQEEEVGRAVWAKLELCVSEKQIGV
jgi:hypothetical protein